jgi:hypothetical protein
MLGNREQFRKGKMQNSWQEACWQLCSECNRNAFRR